MMCVYVLAFVMILLAESGNYTNLICGRKKNTKVLLNSFLSFCLSFCLSLCCCLVVSLCLSLSLFMPSFSKLSISSLSPFPSSSSFLPYLQVMLNVKSLIIDSTSLLDHSLGKMGRCHWTMIRYY